MKTFSAFKIVDANKPDEHSAIVWWDGNHIRTSSESLMRKLRKLVIPFGTKEKTTITYSDGKDFFDALPQAYKSGYTYLTKAEVDETGKLQ